MARFGRAYTRTVTVQRAVPGQALLDGASASLTTAASANLTATTYLDGSAALSADAVASLSAAFLTGSAVVAFNTSASVIAFLRTWTYSSAGTYTWTCPSSVNSVEVMLRAADNGTAGTSPGLPGQNTSFELGPTVLFNAAGGIGTVTSVLTVVPGETYTIVVGAGGAGGAGGGIAGADGYASITVVVALTGSADAVFSTAASLCVFLDGSADASFSTVGVLTPYLFGDATVTFDESATVSAPENLSGSATASFSAEYREDFKNVTATATFSASGELTQIAGAALLSGASAVVFYVAGQPIQGGQLTVGPFTVLVPRGERRAIVLSFASVTDVDLSFHRVRTEALTFTA